MKSVTHHTLQSLTLCTYTTPGKSVSSNVLCEGITHRPTTPTCCSLCVPITLQVNLKITLCCSHRPTTLSCCSLCVPVLLQINLYTTQCCVKSMTSQLTTPSCVSLRVSIPLKVNLYAAQCWVKSMTHQPVYIFNGVMRHGTFSHVSSRRNPELPFIPSM